MLAKSPVTGSMVQALTVRGANLAVLMDLDISRQELQAFSEEDIHPDWSSRSAAWVWS